MKIGIVGLGKLGKIHARIYHKSTNADIACLCDINKTRLKETADILNINPYSTQDYKKVLNKKVSAVSIATDTSSHYEITKFFLENGVHCLVEKPLVTDIKQAKNLLSIARKNKKLLMVGLVERFNSAYQVVKKLAKKPRFIECHRLSCYPHRSLDISVILDLMIHDLDIILDLVKDKVTSVEAVGVNVLSQDLDIANVRLKFKKGCVANITSSRVSQEQTRKIRIFLPSAYISLDYANQEAEIYKKQKNEIQRQQIHIEKDEPLKKEIQNFLYSIHKKLKDYASTHQAITALGLALKIEKKACR